MAKECPLQLIGIHFTLDNLMAELQNWDLKQRLKTAVPGFGK